MATGPGTGGQGAGLGAGGRGGESGAFLFARFPQQWLLRPFLLLLPPLLLLCLCLLPLPPSSPPAPSPGQQAPPAGTSRGRAWHSHSLTLAPHTHRHTQHLPAPFLLSPFLSLLPRLCLPSRSQNEAPGRAEGGAAPTGPAPPSLRGRRKREGEWIGGRQGGLLRKQKRDRLGERQGTGRRDGDGTDWVRRDLDGGETFWDWEQ